MTEDGVVRGAATSSPRHPHDRRRGVRLRSLLLLVVLVPTAGMGLLSVNSALGAQDERQAASRIEEDADALAAIVDARVVLAGEQIVSAVLALAAELGQDVQALSEFMGTDYGARLREARAAVDADPTLAGLDAGWEGLAALREDVDAGTAGFDAVTSVFGGLTSTVDVAWRQRFARLRAVVVSATLPGSVDQRLDAAQDTFDALAAGVDELVVTGRLLLSPPNPGDLAVLLDANSRYLAITGRFPGPLGPRAQDVWLARIADPAVSAYDNTVEQVVDSVLAGTTSTLLDDPVGLQTSLANGATWATQLNALVRAAGSDLRVEGARQADRANRDLLTNLGLAGLVALVSIAAALQLARVVARPTRRLEAAAQAIHDGRFDLPPLEVRGPRELADTASAFNEMTSTLAAVEAHTVALADDPDAPVLGEPLPGRTGRSLQVALNRLRRSIQAAEQHRLDLQEAATHDFLTGLLNRSAAIEVVRRDLPRVGREGGAVVALFLDLDGLKAINDSHGHAAGDDALRMTADALRASTRASDVVARLGGDEFLVSGVVQDVPAEVEALAQRIHQAVAAQVLRCETEEIALRCSIGVALASATDTVDTLIQKADSALYDAKRRGRDRIAWADGDPHPARPADA